MLYREVVSCLAVATDRCVHICTSASLIICTASFIAGLLLVQYNMLIPVSVALLTRAGNLQA